MNGTIFEEIKKKGETNKRDKLKFLAAIIATNILVFFLCQTDFSPPKNEEQKIIHPQYKMMIVPLSLRVDTDFSAKEIPVTIYGKDKKILISKGYIHQRLNDQNVKIEIPDNEVMNLNADPNEEMIAIPFISRPKDKLNTTNYKVTSYEVNF